MIRSFIFFLLPFIFPTLLYILAMLFMQKIAKKESVSLEKALKNHITWLWLAGAGILLLFLTLSLWGLSDPIPPTKTYIPPAYDPFGDGINPGHFNP